MIPFKSLDEPPQDEIDTATTLFASISSETNQCTSKRALPILWRTIQLSFPIEIVSLRDQSVEKNPWKTKPERSTQLEEVQSEIFYFKVNKSL